MTKVTDLIDENPNDVAAGAALALLADSNVAVQMVSDNHDRAFAIRRNDFVVDQVTPEHAAKVYMPKLAAISYKGVTATIGFEKDGELKNPAMTLYNYKDGKKVPLN